VRNNNSGSEDEEEVDQPKGIGAANHLKSMSMRQQPRRRVINEPGVIDGKQTPQMHLKKESSVTIGAPQSSHRRTGGGGYESESEMVAAK